MYTINSNNHNHLMELNIQAKYHSVKAFWHDHASYNKAMCDILLSVLLVEYKLVVVCVF